MNENPQDPQRPDTTPGLDETAGSQGVPGDTRHDHLTQPMNLDPDSTPAAGESPTTALPSRASAGHSDQFGAGSGQSYPQKSAQQSAQQSALNSPASAGQYLPPQHTSPYPVHGGGQDGQRPPWEAAAPVAAPPRKPRRGLAAAAVAGILLLGAGAGAGGAKLWTAANDEPSGNGAPTTSAVVDNGKPVVAEGTVASVAAKVLPSVVKIEVTGQEGSGSGSGIVLSSDGEILTNHHVVEMAETGGKMTVIFNDGSRAPATIVGTDALTDSALIKAENVKDLTPAGLGKSANLVVGQDVVAIGAPFGLNATVTSGIVSALERPVNVGTTSTGNATTYPAIQTDAAINPGNSGGPLVDMSGNVIGINSSIRTASDTSSAAGSIGLGFAIPIDELLPIVQQMRDGETPTHARLGIEVGSAQSGTTLGAPVNKVNPGSTAAKAGLRQGDVITKVDDRLVDGADSLIATVRSYRPGDKVKMTWQRNGKEQSATLTLDSDEGSLAAPPQQQQPQQEQQQPESPFGGTNPFGN